MKKRVRVYKPGGEAQQPTQEQIIGYITQKMQSDDYDPEVLSNELIQVGLTEIDAQKYIDYVSDSLYNSGDDYEDPEANNTEAGYAEYGGAKMSKSKFIKKYTKFAKMAQGGNTPSPGNDDVLNGREAHVKGFLGAVKNTANEAMLREEAENQYNSAYGAPQVGAFQDGGIHQEEVDFENPLHHLSAYGADTRHIFSDNMYTENDVAAMQQYGGNTGQGLYRFMGGGDNESADEMYQDADIDFNQEEYQMGGFKMPKRSGRQYTQAVGSPYYTATGKAADAVDLANRKVTSVDVTKRGIFGRPKAYTVNYDGTTSATPGATPTATPATPTGEYMPPNEFTGDRQPIANWMMRTGIPGIRGLGAKMIDSKQLSEYDVKKNDPEEIKRIQRFHPDYTPLGKQQEEPYTPAKKNYYVPSLSKYSPEQIEKYALRFPGLDDNAIMNETLSFDQPVETNNKMEKIGEQVEELRRKSLGKNFQQYGGPIDYTEYAYGGDVSVPELYRAQVGVEQKLDPNANAIGTTVDFKGNTIDFTGKVIKKRDPKFNFAEGPINEFMKNPFVSDKDDVNPLTGEKPGVRMGSDGNYVNDGLVYDATENEDKQGTSEDYLSKKNWDKTRKNFNTGMMAVNAGLDIFDQVTANRQQNQMLEDITSAESNYGISNEDNRGDYDPNSGLFRPDQMGFNGVARYGGVYANGGSTEDDDEDVQYMTQEEIDDFIANGGELEYL